MAVVIYWPLILAVDVASKVDICMMLLVEFNMNHSLILGWCCCGWISLCAPRVSLAWQLCRGQGGCTREHYGLAGGASSRGVMSGERIQGSVSQALGDLCSGLLLRAAMPVFGTRC